MSKLVGLAGLKSLDQFKSFSGSSGSGASRTFSISSRQPADSVSLGSFANLKLTAEKLVKEQASAKTDLDLANSKLKKLTEDIRALEEKLQNAFNENAKLKVKQKEDEKRWKGLESKFSSTKTLCDQLTETLQILAGQVHDAEKDKDLFANKLSEASGALDDLHEQMKTLSLRVESSEETIRKRDKELKELGIDKGKVEKQLSDEHSKLISLTNEKDNLIKNIEETAAANESTIESLNSKFKELQLQLRSKEEGLRDMQDLMIKKEKENTDLMASNIKCAEQLDKAMEEIKNLERFVNLLIVKLIDLDKQSLNFSEKVVQVCALYDSYFKLVQEEKNLATQNAQHQFDQLHDKFLHATSERDALQLVNQDLSKKVIELQKDQEFTMIQHAEECRLAEEKVLRLESDGETLLSKKAEMENLITTLEEKISTLSEASKVSEKQMQELQLKFSQSEVDNKESSRKLQSEIQRKQEEIDTLQKEIATHEQHVDSLEKQLSQLHSIVEEKERIIISFKDREKQLEDQQAEIQKLLAESESNVAEARKQYDQMLESKQLELSRHLKDISQKNDQAINDIRRKYEVEKEECINLQKEKAGQLVIDMEKKCDQKLAECKEESKQQLLQIEGENATLIRRMQQENEQKEAHLISNHREELKRVQLQAENELREKTKLLKNQHEAELRDLRSQHEEDCRHLEEELNIQKSKEERQRALLQLQWKVMGAEPQEDQEVTSKKNYSTSSKLRKADGADRSYSAVVRREDEGKDLPSLKATQTPASNMLRKVQKGNAGSVVSIPKHSKKVTQQEYEVETAHGRTIKRRKTKSTIMFEDPTKNKKRQTPKANTPGDVVKGIKGGSQRKPANLGDLFSEGSLNPYADDPYAFD